MIYNLSIHNYRLFKSLTIDELKPVNLIVGDNNVGKTTLLEAIHLLTSADPRVSLAAIFNNRGELSPLNNVSNFPEGTNAYQITHLFRRNGNELPKIEIATSNSVQRLLIYPHEHELIFERMDEKKKWPLFGDVVGGFDPFKVNVFRSDVNARSKMLATNLLGFDRLAVLWDQIVLTPKEERVVEALQILEPLVERISFTRHQTATSGALVRLKGESLPLPFGSMGDGIRRILSIVAYLVSVDEGTLLVDEIDTGLHYSALVDMWQLVIETAVKQNAQVFATTHSWDCVRAFQIALNNYEQPEAGKLIRLERKNDDIEPVHYSPDELQIAIQQSIEVR